MELSDPIKSKGFYRSDKVFNHFLTKNTAVQNHGQCFFLLNLLSKPFSMQSKALTVDDYLIELPQERREVMNKLRETILQNIPDGFIEEMNYGMIGYVVPHQIYPNGYHCNPKLPLPFINIASQKNFIALYHMGIYANNELLQWFVDSFPKYSKAKLDMGKSCIRFKKTDQIPFELIAELLQKMTVQNWIACYESQYKK